MAFQSSNHPKRMHNILQMGWTTALNWADKCSSWLSKMLLYLLLSKCERPSPYQRHFWPLSNLKSKKISFAYQGLRGSYLSPQLPGPSSQGTVAFERGWTCCRDRQWGVDHRWSQGIAQEVQHLSMFIKSSERVLKWTELEDQQQQQQQQE